MSHARRAGASIVTALVFAATAMAGSDPLPTRRVNPDYPDSLVSKRVEGWAEVTFHRSPAGEVEHAFVSDSSGEAQLDAALQRAIRAWSYPPTANAHCGTTVYVTMSLGRSLRPPSKGFLRRLSEVEALANEAAPEDAERALSRLDARALTEHAAKFLVAGRLAAARGDLEAELIALRRAVHTNPPPDLADAESVANFREGLRLLGLASPLVARALQRRFTLLVELHQYGEALAFADALRASEAMAPDLERVALDLARLPHGERRVETQGRARRLAALDDAPAIWKSALLRQRIRVDPIAGRVDAIEVCCPDGMASGRPGEWIPVPGPPTACHARVFAEEGARFALIEPPNASRGEASKRAP